MKKKRGGFKLKVNVDLTEWEWGSWPDNLKEAVEVDVDLDCGKVEIKFKSIDEIFEKAAAKIAQEAIAAWLDDNKFWFAEDGLMIYGSDEKKILVCPWKEIWFWNRKSLDAAKSYVDSDHSHTDLEDLEEDNETVAQ